MRLCEQCKQVQAAIKKVDVTSMARKVASAAVVTCALCGAAVGPASPASASAQVPALAEYGDMWPAPPSPAFRVLGQPTSGSPARQVFLPAGRGDSEPPHSDGPEQTPDGSAALYSGTAPTFGVADFLPQRSEFLDSGGAFPTFTVDAWAGRSSPPVRVTPRSLADLPEHAALQQLPPVIFNRVPFPRH